MYNIFLLIGIIFFVGILLLGIIGASFKGKNNKIISKETSLKKIDVNNNKEGYYPKKYFLSKAEYSFYLILLNILPNEHSIFAYPRMIDVIGSNKYGTNKIIKKHIDFVIVHKNMPLLAIELDDSSHQSRQKQDEAKNKIFDAAGFPYLRITAKRSYNTEELKILIAEKLAATTATKPNVQDKTIDILKKESEKL